MFEDLAKKGKNITSTSHLCKTDICSIVLFSLLSSACHFSQFKIGADWADHLPACSGRAFQSTDTKTGEIVSKIFRKQMSTFSPENPVLFHPDLFSSHCIYKLLIAWLPSHSTIRDNYLSKSHKKFSMNYLLLTKCTNKPSWEAAAIPV